MKFRINQGKSALRKGGAFMRAGTIERANIRLFEDPAQKLEFWISQGVGCLKDGDLRGAMNAFGIALRLDRRNPRVWMGLALCYHEMGDHAKSMRAFVRAGDFSN